MYNDCYIAKGKVIFLEHYFTNNENLKSEINELSYSYDNYVFSFLSDNGVFSKLKIDYGSRFLVETYLKNYANKPGDFLDVGCGYGFIGIVLSKVLDVKGTLIDINKRAVHLTNRNIAGNKVNCEAFVSNVYEDINTKFDLIITNPPIRAGKTVLLDILEGSKNYLNDNGECWFVMRKDHGVKTMIKALENTFSCQIIDKSKGFYIVMMKIK